MQSESCSLSTRAPRAALLICPPIFELLHNTFKTVFWVISFGVSFCILSLHWQRTVLFPREILSRRCTLSTTRQGHDEHQFPRQNRSLDYKLLFNPFCVKGYNNPCKMCCKSCAWLCEVKGQKPKQGFSTSKTRWSACVPHAFQNAFMTIFQQLKIKTIGWYLDKQFLFLHVLAAAPLEYSNCLVLSVACWIAIKNLGTK